MPRYDLTCKNPKCGIIVKDMFLLTFKERNEQVCSVCGSEMEPIILGGEGNKPTVIYKGSGFHCTDYPTGGSGFKP